MKFTSARLPVLVVLCFVLTLFLRLYFAQAQRTSFSTPMPATARLTVPRATLRQTAGAVAQADEALAYYRLKRTGEAGAPLSEARYREALARLCQMPQHSLLAGKSVDASSANTDLMRAGWQPLGPSLSAATDLTAASCETDATAILAALLDPQRNLAGVSQGAASADGKALFAAALGSGLWQGSSAWKKLDTVAGTIALDPQSAEHLFASLGGLQLYQSDNRGQAFTPISNGINDQGLFAPPLALEPSNAQHLWTGGSAIWRSADGGGQWEQVGQLTSGKASAMAIAPEQAFVLVGTSAGEIYRSADVTATTWQAVQPRAGFVSSLIIDEQTVYATYSSFGGAHVWRSRDAGRTWESLDGAGLTALPDVPVHALVADSTQAGRMFVATDLGLFVTYDGGLNWLRLQTGFGLTPVASLQLQQVAGRATLYAFTQEAGVWQTTLEAEADWTYSLSAATATVNATGGAGSVNVLTTNVCAWTAKQQRGVADDCDGRERTGNGSVQYQLRRTPNACRAPGVLTIGGQTLSRHATRRGQRAP
ncbi:MAG: hypothetical protein U0Y68_02515 [Blastocatellia bacterium]